MEQDTAEQRYSWQETNATSCGGARMGWKLERYSKNLAKTEEELQAALASLFIETELNWCAVEGGDTVLDIHTAHVNICTVSYRNCRGKWLRRQESW